MYLFESGFWKRIGRKEKTGFFKKRKIMLLEVLIGPLGWAVVVCPRCGLKDYSRPAKELQNRILDQVCRCGLQYQLIFDSRSVQRKPCSFPGILLADQDIPVTIRNISESGAYFESDDMTVDVGGFYKLKMVINDCPMDVVTRIVRFNRNMAGVKFVTLGTDQKKIIESYIFPSA